MPRLVPEWIGATDDTPVPDRVRLRVLKKHNECCASCGRHITTGTRWICDHTVALINSGPNRETNLRPLCSWCTPAKDASDVAEKSATYGSQKRNFGLRKAKGKPIMGSRASGWRHKMDGTWERRS